MNIKILEILKEWTMIAKNYDSFSDYLEKTSQITVQARELKENIKEWFTPTSFISYCLDNLFSALLILSIPVAIVSFIMGNTFYQFTTFVGTSLFFYFLFGFFFFQPRKNQKILKEKMNKLSGFDEKIRPFVQNNELISLIIPDFKTYCLKNNKEKFFNEFIFRSMNEQILFTDVAVIYEFLTDYFKNNVNADNYSEIIQSSDEFKGSHHIANKKESHFEFFVPHH